MSLRSLDANREFAATPLLAALSAGIVAVYAPTLALVVLAALAARVLMRGNPTRIDVLALAGPAFAALIVGALLGFAYAIGVVFIWRLAADARWSVRRAARLAQAEGRPAEATRRALAHAWLTPLFGLTLVAYTAPHMIAGLPLDLPHAPLWVPALTGGLAGVAFFDWALRRAADWRLGELAIAQTLHLLAHHGLFLLAFGLTLDVSAGLVALIAWRLTHALPTRQASFTAVP
jgi:hypothetical protein